MLNKLMWAYDKLLQAIGLTPLSRFEAMCDQRQQEMRRAAHFVERLLTAADCEEVRKEVRAYTPFQFYTFGAPPAHKLVNADDHGERAIDQAKCLSDALSVMQGRAAELTVQMRRLSNTLGEARSAHTALRIAQEKPERRFATGGEFHIPARVSLQDAFKAHLAAKKHNEIGHVDDETGRVCITVRDYHESDALVDRPFYRYREGDMTGDPWVLYNSADEHMVGDAYDIWTPSGTLRSVHADYPVYIQKEDYERMTWAPEGEA